MRRPVAMVSRTVTLAVAVGIAVSVVPRGATAFCRQVSVNPPAGYRPTPIECFGTPQGDAGPFFAYWSNLCVGYSLQRDASRQVTLDQATRLATQAFAAWNQVACVDGGGSPSITAVDEGPVRCGQVQYNQMQPNQHVIVFRDDGWSHVDQSNTLGLTTLTVNLLTGEIYDADMEINSKDYTFIVDADGGVPDGAYDLLTVLTHEAGHFLGLAHSPDPTAVMYTFYNPVSSVLTPDDVDGICAIDPVDGLHTTSAGSLTPAACDPTPRHGFSTECASGAAGTDGGFGAEAGAVGAAGGNPAGGSAKVASRGCSVSSAPSPPWRLGVPGVGLLGAGVLVRRKRKTGRPWRSAVVAAVFSLVALGGAGSLVRDADASVSVAILFDELVHSASAAAVVTAVDQRAQWEDGRIYTHTRIRVDTPIAGQLPPEAWVRTLGGGVGDIGQIVDGEPSLAVGTTSLLFLRPDVDPTTKAAEPGRFTVVARAQGQFFIAVGEDGQRRLLRSPSVGALAPPAVTRFVAAATLHPPAERPRLARDVLHERRLVDAIRDLEAAWPRLHVN